jgi:hypothetical protein
MVLEGEKFVNAFNSKIKMGEIKSLHAGFPKNVLNCAILFTKCYRFYYFSITGLFILTFAFQHS